MIPKAAADASKQTPGCEELNARMIPITPTRKQPRRARPGMADPFFGGESWFVILRRAAG
jgi:hypothetical protein